MDERENTIFIIKGKETLAEKREIALSYLKNHSDDAEFRLFVGETICHEALGHSNLREDTIPSDSDEQNLKLSPLEEALQELEKIPAESEFYTKAREYQKFVHYYLAEKITNTKKRISHYATLIDNFGERETAVLPLAKIHVAQKKWDKAEACLESLLKPEISGDLSTAIHWYFGENHPNVSYRLIHYLALKDNPAALLRATLLCTENNQWDEAEVWANKAISIGLPEELKRSIHIFFAENLPDAEKRIAHYNALREEFPAKLVLSREYFKHKPSLVEESTQYAEAALNCKGKDVQKETIDAINLFIAEHSAIEKAIEHYLRLDSGKNILLNKALSCAKSGNWGIAELYIKGAYGVNGKDNPYVIIAHALAMADKYAPEQQDGKQRSYREGKLLEEKFRNTLFSELEENLETLYIFAGAALARKYEFTTAIVLVLAKKTLDPTKDEPEKQKLNQLINKISKALLGYYLSVTPDIDKINSKPAKARSWAERIRSIEPLNHQAALILARASLVEGKTKEAIKYYREYRLFAAANIPESDSTLLEARLMIARDAFLDERIAEARKEYEVMAITAKEEFLEWQKRSTIVKDRGEYTHLMNMWYGPKGDLTSFMLCTYICYNEIGKVSPEQAEAVFSGDYALLQITSTLTKSYDKNVSPTSELVFKLYTASRDKVNLSNSETRKSHFGYDPLAISESTSMSKTLQLTLRTLKRVCGGKK